MVLACGLGAGLRFFSLWATSGDELAPGDFTAQAGEWVFDERIWKKPMCWLQGQWTHLQTLEGCVRRFQLAFNLCPAGQSALSTGVVEQKARHKQ